MCNGFYVCFFFSQTSTQNKLMGSLAGGLAGACQIIITTPMELLKIQQQDQGRTGTIPWSFWNCSVLHHSYEYSVIGIQFNDL